MHEIFYSILTSDDKSWPGYKSKTTSSNHASSCALHLICATKQTESCT